MSQPPPFKSNNPSWVAPGRSHQYPPQTTPQQQHHQKQERPQRGARAKSANSFTPPTPLWCCEYCGNHFPDLFEAGNRQILTEHQNCRGLSEREVLAAKEEQKRAELEALRSKVAAMNKKSLIPGLDACGWSHNPVSGTKKGTSGLAGYQGSEEERKAPPSAPIVDTPMQTTPTFTSSTIRPLPTPQQSTSNDSELGRLRRENSSLKIQLEDLKKEVRPRIEALAGQLKSLVQTTKMHELKISIVVKSRDDLKAELDALQLGYATTPIFLWQNGNDGPSGDGHQEIPLDNEELDMDFA